MTLPALPDPTAVPLPAIIDRCAAVEAWAETLDDLDAGVAMLDRGAAIETFLLRQGVPEPAWRMNRTLELRIGELLGPAEVGRPKVPREVPLAKNRVHEFRLMAEYRAVWVDDRARPRNRILRVIRDEQARQSNGVPERDEAEASVDLRLGDFREVLADIPDGTVDVILTDPPYPAEFLPLWSDLGAFAARVLAPHGLLVAMSGQTHLPEVFTRLGEHLRYRWTIAYLASGQATTVHGRRVHSMWKPVLVYGDRTRRLYDVARSDAAEKVHHDWGQSESGMADLLRLAADPGQLIVDPFTGGGTTAVVAREFGCPFIGAEIDEVAYNQAMRRLA